MLNIWRLQFRQLNATEFNSIQGLQKLKVLVIGVVAVFFFPGVQGKAALFAKGFSSKLALPQFFSSQGLS